ncbi:Splicing factor Prp8, partial [Spraguea lophii 42_110]
QYEEDNNYNCNNDDKGDKNDDDKDNNTTNNNNINNTTNITTNNHINTNDINAKNMTLAQRRGLSTIPNKKFTLWWSPCINTSNVYVGYITVLDGTGISMHGKIPTLKLNYINMFRDRLWIKIHKSIVDKIYNEINNIYNGDRSNRNNDINKNSDIDGYDSNNKINNNIPNIKLLPTHKRKSLRMSNGAADILIENIDSIFITEYNNNCNDGNGNKYTDDTINIDTNINNTNNNITNTNINNTKNNIYIDIQLRWGDYSKKDIHKYAKRKYLEYNNDPLSFYPCDKGLIIVYDLCYNTYSYYGYIPIVLYKHNNRDDDNDNIVHDNKDNNSLTTNYTTTNNNIIINSCNINNNNITAINNILDNISKNNRYLITLRE